MTARAAPDPPAVRVRELTVAFPADRREVPAVCGVSVDLRAGQITGLVGESGSGKSTLALALLNAVPKPGRVTSGTVDIDGTGDVLSLSAAGLRRVRGAKIGFVFQASQNSLNPLKPTGKQLLDLGRSHGVRDLRALLGRARELLERMGLDAVRVLSSYQHELSGGIRQRVGIVFALVLNARVLVLDEPTTALDMLSQAAVLDIVRNVHEELGLTTWSAPASLEALMSANWSQFTRRQCFIVDFLVHFRRHISTVRMDTHLVIPPHPVCRGDHHIINALPIAAEIDKLSLVQTVQRFRRSIIIRVTFTPDRTHRPGVFKPLSVTDRRVLHAAIGMVDQPVNALVPPRPDRHFQRIEREICLQVASDLPAENAAGEQVHHERGIYEIRGDDGHVRDVRDPAAIRRGSVEPAFQQVLRHARRVAGNRGARPPATAPGAVYPQFTH